MGNLGGLSLSQNDGQDQTEVLVFTDRTKGSVHSGGGMGSVCSVKDVLDLAVCGDHASWCLHFTHNSLYERALSVESLMINK